MQRESVLDLTLITKQLASRATNWQVLGSTSSNHHLILFAIQAKEEHLPKTPKGTKFNTEQVDSKLFSTTLIERITIDPVLRNLSLFL